MCLNRLPPLNDSWMDAFFLIDPKICLFKTSREHEGVRAVKN